MHAVLDSVKSVSATSKTFYFNPEQRLDHIAGQFVELTLAHSNPDNRGIRRWFTVSSSPTEELLALTVKFPSAQPSTFKQTLLQLKPGTAVHLSDPLGDFVLPLDTIVPLVWIAGGIGITPFRSMAQWLKDSGEERQISLLHSSANTGEEIASFNKILSSRIPKDHYHTGNFRLDAPTILNKLPLLNVADSLFYISGSESLVESVTKDLQTHGIARHQLISDAFLGYA